MSIKLIVFDLDFTLWDAGGTWIDHTRPPFNKKNGVVYDSNGAQILLYPDTLPVLKKLKAEGIKIAVASRTERPEWAREIMSMYDIAEYFYYQEIYPGSKTSHFRSLRGKSGVPFVEMMFFDDEERNISEVSILGVECVLVDAGISIDIVNTHIL